MDDRGMLFMHKLHQDSFMDHPRIAAKSMRQNSTLCYLCKVTYLHGQGCIPTTQQVDRLEWRKSTQFECYLQLIYFDSRQWMFAGPRLDIAP